LGRAPFVAEASRISSEQPRPVRSGGGSEGAFREAGRRDP